MTDPMTPTTQMTGETIYRLWWQEMWATGGEKPQLQWEQLTEERQAVWNRLAYRLTQGAFAESTEYGPPVEEWGLR